MFIIPIRTFTSVPTAVFGMAVPPDHDDGVMRSHGYLRVFIAIKKRFAPAGRVKIIDNDQCIIHDYDKEMHRVRHVCGNLPHGSDQDRERQGSNHHGLYRLRGLSPCLSGRRDFSNKLQLSNDQS